ncbi:MAG: DUF1549 domain-containing protein, partial [Pirellulales bacterium]
MQRVRGLLTWAGLLLLAALSAPGWSDEGAPQADEQAPKFDAASIEFFEKSVRPLLVARCYECHGADVAEPKGGLRLDSRAAVLKGGDTGPAALAGKPGQSVLVEAINYSGAYEMPPKSKLPADEIATLTRWVEMGLPWPAESAATNSDAKNFDLAKRRAEHWCWQPLAKTTTPTPLDRAWPRSAIDAFLLDKLEKKGLSPAAPAERRTLLRRLSYDLVGLPPTPDELAEFLADGSPDAVERVVDRLLASPGFGERWGRHWLDVVRYAESRGHEFDFTAANAHEYRDYVIRALNRDLPYDQFVVEHVAGDLVEPPRLHPRQGFNESILGTGFWYLGEWIHSPVDIRKDETDRIDNSIDVFGKAFLGLTIACARCHDHKFDALSTADYYALSGYLQSSSYRQVPFEALPHNRRIAEELRRLDDEQIPQLRRAVTAALRPGVEQLAKNLLAPPSDAWRKHLLAAAKDPHDVLHAWASASAGLGQDAKDFAPALAALASAAVAGQAASEKALAEAKIVVDYAALTPTDWMQDGLAFGLGPARTGDVIVGGDAGWPLVGVHRFGAARRDAAFAEITPAAGNEND